VLGGRPADGLEIGEGDGLVTVRNTARSRDFEWCKAESEYLHETPSPIGKADLTCHLYQATGARKLYPKWIADSGGTVTIEYVNVFYVSI
jgi:hypothetical protein